MATAAIDELGHRVRQALRDTNVPLWLPGLTADLTEFAWQRLARDVRLTRATYGTARMLRQDPGEMRRVLVYLKIPSLDGAGRDAIPVELLPEELERRCAGPDIGFFDGEQILGDPCSRIEDALRVLGTVPTVLTTVCSLVRALHLIDPVDDDYDVSFSDPLLPFSAFVSVPRARAPASKLRIAEALLHEAMHLQLTLVEAVVPLVAATERTFFSPWRNEHRTAQGVLHGLYVFRVIDSFLGTARFEFRSSACSRQHAAERRAAIARQVRDMSAFRGCSALTEDGATLVDRLLG